MDTDETLTPRTGRKKKSSALSKLAARGRRKIEEENGSESPSSSLDQNQHKYPIDANVEIRNTTNNLEDDSDEGIEVTTDSFPRDLNSYSRPNPGTNGDEDWVQSDSQPKGYSSSKYPKEDDLHLQRRDEKKFRGRSSPGVSDTEGSSSSPGDFVKNEVDDEKAEHVMHVREVLDSEKMNHGGNNPQTGIFRNKEMMNEELESASTGPFRSNLVSGVRSRSDEDLTDKYRRVMDRIEKQDDEGEGGEKEEMDDNISALRQMLPKAGGGGKGPTTASLYSSQERTWGSMNKFGAFDTLSQRSFQSTSVLPLITTKEARDRSFLVGSMSGRAALMGLEEMERFFPDHKIRVFTGTWNMCDMKLLPSSLDDWLLPDSSDYIQDMYVIGTQESCSNRKEWEIRIQETLGPSHVLFHSATHGVLYITVFLRRDLIWFCSVTEEDRVTTRLGPSNIATKGAVGLCFTFFGTSFLFIDTHLTPHDGKVKERIADYNKIISSLNLPQLVISNPYSLTQEDVTARFDCVFWMGDLNFRLEKERERLDKTMEAIDTQEIPSYEDLMRHDELFRVRNEGLAFQEFQEGRIKFKPTYKYDRGTDDFDTSKKLRIPSYTDRILFRSKRKNAITCLFYDSVPALKDSDHKPVYAMFEVAIRPGRDNIPLSAGQFNREIWLEGNRRRAERLEKQKHKSKTSSVCSIQ